jgi:hypothetical protein
MLGEFLRKVTAALEIIGVPYMLTGSLASSMYGIPRATNDIDIIIAPTREQLLSVIQFFKRMDLYVEETALTAFGNRTQFNVIDFPRGWKVDLIMRGDREFSTIEFDRRETHEVEDMRLTIAAPEDVVIAKMEWAKLGDSERQLVDAAGVLRMQAENLDLAYIDHWVKTLGLEEQWADVRRRALG